MWRDPVVSFWVGWTASTLWRTRTSVRPRRQPWIYFVNAWFKQFYFLYKYGRKATHIVNLGTLDICKCFVYSLLFISGSYEVNFVGLWLMRNGFFSFWAFQDGSLAMLANAIPTNLVSFTAWPENKCTLGSEKIWSCIPIFLISVFVTSHTNMVGIEETCSSYAGIFLLFTTLYRVRLWKIFFPHRFSENFSCGVSEPGLIRG